MRNAAAVTSLRSMQPSILEGPVSGREAIIEVLKVRCPAGEGAEIGTFNGTFAGEMLERTAIGKLFCVDPYTSYDDFHDAINNMDLQAIFEQAQRFLARFPERVQFIREFSLPAATTVADESLDFVYIDGNHQFKYAFDDLAAWWPKLKNGGYMMGDDAVDTDDSLRNENGDVRFVHTRKPDGTDDLYGEYGVFHAVRSFAHEHQLDYVLTGSQFIIPKV